MSERDRDVLRLIRPCRPDHAVLTDPSEDERRVMEELGFRSTDASGLRTHVKAFPAPDDD